MIILQDDYPFNTCAWSPGDMRDWIISDLGPILETAGYGDVQVMVFDHNREYLPTYPQIVRKSSIGFIINGTRFILQMIPVFNVVNKKFHRRINLRRQGLTQKIYQLEFRIG